MRKMITMTAALLLLAVAAKAQVFLMEEDASQRDAIEVVDMPNTPFLNQTNDQYAPLGGGMLALGLLGGAYLLNKRRKED